MKPIQVHAVYIQTYERDANTVVEQATTKAQKHFAANLREWPYCYKCDNHAEIHIDHTSSGDEVKFFADLRCRCHTASARDYICTLYCPTGAIRIEMGEALCNRLFADTISKGPFRTVIYNGRFSLSDPHVPWPSIEANHGASLDDDEKKELTIYGRIVKKWIKEVFFVEHPEYAYMLERK